MRALFARAIEAIVVTTDEGAIVDANPAAHALLGPAANLAAALGVPWPQLIAPGRRELAVSVGGSPLVVELEAAGGVVPDRYVFFLRDVTRTKQLEAELARTTERCRVLFQAAPIPKFVYRQRDRRIVEANDRSASLFGLPVEAMIGRTAEELGVVFEGPVLAEYRRQLSELGAVRDLPVTLRDVHGTRRDVLVTTVPLALDGEPCWLSAMIDVTEQRALEQRVLNAQKLDAIGRLAGGIAHDFNNVLAVIRGFADVALEEITRDSPAADDLRQILAAVERGGALTTRLLTFGRRQRQRLAVIDARELVASLEPMLRRSLGPHARLVTRRGGPARVHADPAQLEQVVLNLVVNARDALPAGGTVHLETSTRVRNDRAWFVVEVRDDGVGMDAQTRARALEPFFTTKANRPGLGLAMVYGIVTQSGGEVDVQSTPSEGTTVTVWLPQTDAPIDVPIDDDGAAPELRGHETVLVVEDDDSVRHLVRTVLRRAGYFVIEAMNAGDAIMACERHEGEIDLVVSDVEMPWLRGPELVTRLRALRPNLAVLFMTGYAADDVVERSTVPPLAKPFSAQALLTRVRSALAAPREAT
ncbi:MAG: response regulator [Deltaproteobacteria bacterium]|nr:response regulator [Deltaproteobacteria bacterium]